LEVILNKYLKFGSNAIILISLFILTDQVIGRVLRHFYFKQESGLYYRTTYAIDSTKADILVFGSSRANHHYVPEVFEDRLNLSFYNSGRDGNFLLNNYGIFKAVLKRYTPKIIIFDINNDELLYEKTNYDRLSSLLPYYKDHPEIRNIIELKSPYEKFKLISEIYPFNSSLITMAIGNMRINKIRIIDQKGYIPLINKINDTILYTTEYKEGIVDSNLVNAVREINYYCKLKKIDLVFIQSPVYANIKNTFSNEFFEKFAMDEKIMYLNFNNNPQFLTKPEYFQDQNHLNNGGARFFSNLVVEQIIRSIEIKRTVTLN